MKKYLPIIILFTTLIVLIAILGNYCYNRTLEFGAGCPPCEVCDNRITSDRIIGGTVNYEHLNTMTKIILPASVGEVQIGKDIWTKEEMLEIKKPVKL